MTHRKVPDTGPAEAEDDESGAAAAAAFRRLFEQHFAELYRFAYRYVRAEDTAQDLVHEGFLQLWRQREQVDLTAPAARSYLYTVVRYQALDHLRHRRVEDRWRQEYSAPAVIEAGVTLAPDPDHELSVRELAAAVRQAVDALPLRQRQVIHLRWHQQASYEQIAETLGISSKTVGIHIGRAIKRLREVLAQIR
jgi:RNA polymerase sigma-70 factor (ECF subfamily)